MSVWLQYMVKTFQQQDDVIRIKFERTIWAALGEPVFRGQNKHGEVWQEATAVDQEESKK